MPATGESTIIFGEPWFQLTVDEQVKATGLWPVGHVKAATHTVVAQGAGVRFHESSAEPLRVWENRMKNPG